MSEAELLDRFVRARDEGAFAVLVDRHGPMVLGICRRFLTDPHDAEDAFQATFLILVRRAGSLRQKELLGNWLYGVACKVSQRARVLGYRRRGRFASSDPIEGELRSRSGTPFEDRSSVLEEVLRLPSKYRSPILLCYFDGLSHDEAASRLGWPVGTVKGRLSRARDLLRPRLERRGLGIPATALTALLTSLELRASVPDQLTSSTIKVAESIVLSTSASVAKATLMSSQVCILYEGVSRAMLLAQVRSMIVPALLTAGVLAGGATVTARLLGAQAGPTQPSRPSHPSQKTAKQSDVATADPTRREAPPTAGGGIVRAGTEVMAGGGGMGGGGGGFGGGGGGEAPDPNDSRIVIARLSAKLAAADKSPRNQAILKKLDEPVSLHFPSETPLEEVLKRIKESAKSGDGRPLPIYVDPTGLAEAEKTLTSPVVIDLQDVPLRFSLRLALKQLGMAYCVRDGVVIVSSVEGIQQELMELLAEQQMLNPEQFPVEPGQGRMMRQMMGGGGAGMGGMMGGMGGGAGGMGGGMR